MVRTNEQLADMSLQLSQARKANTQVAADSQAQATADSQAQAERIEWLENALKQAKESTALVSQVEVLHGGSEQVQRLESSLKQAREESAALVGQVEALRAQVEQVESAALVSQVEALRGGSEQVEHLESSLKQAREERAALVRQVEALRGEVEQVERLESSLKQAKEESAALVGQVEALQGEVEQRDSEGREATMAQLKLEEVLVELRELQEERQCWVAQVAKLERELTGARESVVEAERLCAVPTHCLEPSSWEDEKASLSFKVQALQGEVLQLTARAEDLGREVEEARSDGRAESEILQARISELTQEKADVESLCKELERGASKLKTQLEEDGRCASDFTITCPCYLRTQYMFLT